jgi:hypothetical protein
MTLDDLGWDEAFAAAFAEAAGAAGLATEAEPAAAGLVPARVVAQSGAYRIAIGTMETLAVASGRPAAAGSRGHGRAARGRHPLCSSLAFSDLDPSEGASL